MMTDEKRLVRLDSDRMIAGVCSGLAAYFDIDVALVRLAFVLVEVATAGAGGIMAYLILWVIMPDERTASTLAR